MMIKLDFKETRSTDAYRFTTDDMDCQEVKDLKAMVAANNAEVRKFSRSVGRPVGRLKRVRFMGRGPRAELAKAQGKWARSLDSYLPLDLAEKFDVYVHEDNTAMDMLKRELTTGMTPGELARVDRLKSQIWRIELEGMSRLRNKPEWIK